MWWPGCSRSSEGRRGTINAFSTFRGYDEFPDQRTLFGRVPLELERLKKHEEYAGLLDASIEFVPTCPLVYLTVHGDGLKNVLTDTPPTLSR